MSESGHSAFQAHSEANDAFVSFCEENPHKNCQKCNSLLLNYAEHVKNEVVRPWAILSEDNEDVEKDGEDEEEKNQNDLCFPCPHCKRRFVKNFSALENHLINDHRNFDDGEIENPEENVFQVFRLDSDEATTCDFCERNFAGSFSKFNKHLVTCPQNRSEFSSGLFCQICGKMFALARNLKEHMLRHGRDRLQQPRNHFCKQCPVGCPTKV